MKFAMNGALLLATLDGANVEIRDAIGKANVFIFGTRAEKVEEMRHLMRMEQIPADPRLVEVLKLLRGNLFGEPKGCLFFFFFGKRIVVSFSYSSDWAPVIDSISRGNDYYLLNADFPLYCNAQDEVNKAYRDQRGWLRRCVFSIARSGIFSSDRTILQLRPVCAVGLCLMCSSDTPKRFGTWCLFVVRVLQPCRWPR